MAARHLRSNGGEVVETLPGGRHGRTQGPQQPGSPPPFDRHDPPTPSRDGVWTSPDRLPAASSCSTVYGVLRRQGRSSLHHIKRAARTAARYERDCPGELIHLDVEKPGRILNGAASASVQDSRRPAAGANVPGAAGGTRLHPCLHVAGYDHSRSAHAEALPGERGATSSGFRERAVLAFAEVGTRVERILTNNHGSYRRFRPVKAVAGR